MDSTIDYYNLNAENFIENEVLFRIARYFDKPVEDVFWYE